MALSRNNQLPDDIQDGIGICLARLNAIPTWTAEKAKLFAKFDELARELEYVVFTGDFRDYHLERKGQHCLYDLPMDQRGGLHELAGKRIRLVCGDRFGKSSSSSGRVFYAKAVAP